MSRACQCGCCDATEMICDGPHGQSFRNERPAVILFQQYWPTRECPVLLLATPTPTGPLHIFVSTPSVYIKPYLVSLHQQAAASQKRNADDYLRGIYSGGSFHHACQVVGHKRIGFTNSVQRGALKLLPMLCLLNFEILYKHTINYQARTWV